mmetsp:Transcript_60077/g.159788  ORF Transcript_60077/g.159788 Transcript_60077/m.159788 type:complete len:291 (+) Transcript_60077:701-1573(+)
MRCLFGPAPSSSGHLRQGRDWKRSERTRWEWRSTRATIWNHRFRDTGHAEVDCGPCSQISTPLEWRGLGSRSSLISKLPLWCGAWCLSASGCSSRTQSTRICLQWASMMPRHHSSIALWWLRDTACKWNSCGQRCCSWRSPIWFLFSVRWASQFVSCGASTVSMKIGRWVTMRPNLRASHLSWALPWWRKISKSLSQKQFAKTLLVSLCVGITLPVLRRWRQCWKTNSRISKPYTRKKGRMWMRSKMWNLALVTIGGSEECSCRWTSCSVFMGRHPKRARGTKKLFKLCC